MAKIPGRSLPSSHSKNAPPADETYENLSKTPALLIAETVSPPPATDIILFLLVQVKVE